jgi:hypothetical protein
MKNKISSSAPTPNADKPDRRHKSPSTKTPDLQNGAIVKRHNHTEGATAHRPRTIHGYRHGRRMSSNCTHASRYYWMAQLSSWTDSQAVRKIRTELNSLDRQLNSLNNASKPTFLKRNNGTMPPFGPKTSHWHYGNSDGKSGRSETRSFMIAWASYGSQQES